MPLAGFARAVLLLGVCISVVVAHVHAASAQPADPDLIKRGEYLATAGDCAACHTAPGGRPFAGGSYLESPFGGIAVPNITPDKATGIGAWSDDDFYRAMHEGIAPGGVYLYPAFPFPWYTNVTRADALAIKAYLFSLDPVAAPKNPEKLRFPFNVREGLLAWRTLFFKPAQTSPGNGADDPVSRGAYLVEGLGHCGECHNRNNVLGASDWSGKLEGGEIQGWYAPNITSDGSEGVGRWSADQIVTFLKTGVSPSGGPVLGPMSETVEHSLSHLTDSDLAAIAAYLKSVPAQQTYTAKTLAAFRGPNAPASASYLEHCASCHLPNGQGMPGAVPALAGNGAVKAGGPENVIRVVLGGLPAMNGMGPMPAVGVGMTDEDVVAAVDYVRQAWGNQAPVTEGPGTVGILRAQTHSLLAGNQDGGCPPLTDATLAQAFTQANGETALQAMQQGVETDKIDTLLAGLMPRVKAQVPDVKDDDVVNALTRHYCAVLAPAHLSQADMAARLGNFTTVLYGRMLKANAK